MTDRTCFPHDERLYEERERCDRHPELDRCVNVHVRCSKGCEVESWHIDGPEATS